MKKFLSLLALLLLINFSASGAIQSVTDNAGVLKAIRRLIDDGLI